VTKLNSRRAQKGKRENLNFTRIGQGGQTLTIRPQDGADASFFGFTKAAKIAKMTPNDLLTLEMIFTEPLKKTEQNSFLVSLNSLFLSI